MAQTLTDEECETLLACVDTVAPAIAAEELKALAPQLADDVSQDTIAAFAAEVPSNIESLREDLKYLLPSQLPPAKLADLKMVLGLLR